MIRGRTTGSAIGITLDAADAQALARFYRDLLGWELVEDTPPWCTLSAPGSPVTLAVKGEPLHEPPTWPAEPGAQQMQAHLELPVSDLDGAVRDALALGAKLPGHQPQSHVRVLIDPAGHPFCLYTENHTEDHTQSPP
jgi:catechol 2,3-dioxygenase-like lactoylglutathione lyase family enzyme